LEEQAEMGLDGLIRFSIGLDNGEGTSRETYEMMKFTSPW
jgi:hypothetical protein